MSFFPQSKFGSGKSERESNPVPSPLNTCLSGAVVLAN